MSNEPNKVIYSMVGVGKYYDKKAVLKDIYLSYFYGAKIGVIGLNGSGKSSLLRIMAGVDKEINGEAVLSPGYTVGYLGTGTVNRRFTNCARSCRRSRTRHSESAERV